MNDWQEIQTSRATVDAKGFQTSPATMSANKIEEAELLIVGAGPAGLKAALAAAEFGVSVLLLERDAAPGGQLVKQTHKFFGSEKQDASVRGIEIAAKLRRRLEENAARIDFRSDACALGFYEDGVLTAEIGGCYTKIRPQSLIVATGASEKFLSFPGNDLPGVVGAGAVQTLMNVYGVLPAKRVLMVGAGNIGLIVSYQLIQSGVEVVSVIDAAPRIGGYLVHAAKLRRAGVPILCSHGLLRADGRDSLESATLTALDEKWQPVPGSEKKLDVDLICVAVGLSPLSELLWQAGCKMRYIPELGGYVALRDAELMTSREGIYLAGDVGGIEEASSAMAEGELAGLSAAIRLGYGNERALARRQDCYRQLRELRQGPGGEKTRRGLGMAQRFI